MSRATAYVVLEMAEYIINQWPFVKIPNIVPEVFRCPGPNRRKFLSPCSGLCSAKKDEIADTGYEYLIVDIMFSHIEPGPLYRYMRSKEELANGLVHYLNTIIYRCIRLSLKVSERMHYRDPWFL
jgi:hypothetical protein